MATTKAQRWGILAILIVTVVGTVGSFAVMGLAADNDAREAAKVQEAQAQYSDDLNEYQAKVDAQSDELSSEYYNTFKGYSSRVGEFDLDGVKSLVKKDLVVGKGEKIDGTTKFAAYYIGWNPKGKIFDQSIDTDAKKLKQPLYEAVSLDLGLDNASLIQGWIDGMKGMRIGGIRELTIPSDQAYGETGQGDDIPPNTPIKFVVMAIPAPDVIAQPEIPEILLQQYYQ